jgi:hypothetical protein
MPLLWSQDPRHLAGCLIEEPVRCCTIGLSSEQAKVILSLSKGTLALLSRNREKSSFDKPRMISRYAQLSNLQLVAP